MAGSVNKVILVGNLGRDPEIKQFANGGMVVNFTVATSENWRDKNTGERRERTEWHRVVIKNDKLGEIAQKYLRKGSKVYLEGELQTRDWMDKDNQKRSTTEVVLQGFRCAMTLLDSRGGGGAGAMVDEYANGADSATDNGGGRPSSRASARDVLDDDVPF